MPFFKMLPFFMIHIIAIRYSAFCVSCMVGTNEFSFGQKFSHLCRKIKKRAFSKKQFKSLVHMENLKI